MESEWRSHLGPTRLHALDATLACLRAAGFSVVSSYRAQLLLDSYVYGFTLQETSWRIDGSDPDGVAEGVRRLRPAGTRSGSSGWSPEPAGHNAPHHIEDTPSPRSNRRAPPRWRNCLY